MRQANARLGKHVSQSSFLGQTLMRRTQPEANMSRVGFRDTVCSWLGPLTGHTLGLSGTGTKANVITVKDPLGHRLLKVSVLWIAKDLRERERKLGMAPSTT